MPNTIHITTLDDPRLDDYHAVKERQLAAPFAAAGVSGTPEAPFGKLYAEGPLVLDHLLHSRHTPLSILTTPTRLAALTAELTAPIPDQLPIYLLPQQQLDRVIGFNMHRGLLAIAARAKVPTLDELLASIPIDAKKPRPGPLVVLEGLSNHDNVGAIFRHAAAFGAAGVLLSPNCADPLYRKSVRVSMGHALRVPWSWAPHDPANPTQGLSPQTLAALHHAGWTTLALTPRGEHDLDMIAINRTMIQGVALLIGAEGPGLTTPSIAAASHAVRIAMAPGVDSLNAATTAAIALYELTRPTCA